MICRLKNKENGFTLVELLLGVTILIVIYIGATTAQISSEFFLKNIRADFEKHLELNNALDRIIKDVRSGQYNPPSTPIVQPAYLELSTRTGVIGYTQSGNNIVRLSETIAENARVNFSPVGGRGVRVIVEEITSDSQKIKIVLISTAFLRDKP